MRIKKGALGGVIIGAATVSSAPSPVFVLKYFLLKMACCSLNGNPRRHTAFYLWYMIF